MAADFLTLVLSYVIVFGLAIFVLQLISHGLIFTLLKVKGSRGKKILINVKSKVQHYYTTGEIQEDFIVYHDRVSKANEQKTPKRTVIPSDKEVFYKLLGVICCNINESDNSFITPGGERVTGLDAIKFSNLYVRALTKPSDEDVYKILKILSILILILLVFAVIILFVKIGSVENAVKALNTVPEVAGNVI